MEPDPVEKPGSEVLEFEKNVIEPDPTGSNFGITWLKLVPEEELSHKCENRTGDSILKDEEAPNTAFNPVWSGGGRLLSLDPVISRLLIT
jgi:hypothetical protein